MTHRVQELMHHQVERLFIRIGRIIRAGRKYDTGKVLAKECRLIGS